MMITAVYRAAVAVPPGERTVLHRAEGPAVPVAEAVLMIIAAVYRAAVAVPPGERTVLHGAEGPAVSVTEAVLMMITAVYRAAVAVPANGGTALHRADSYGGRLDGILAVAAAVAPAAVGGGRKNQRSSSQHAEQTSRKLPLHPHNKQSSHLLCRILKYRHFYYSTARWPSQDAFRQGVPDCAFYDIS